MNLDGRNVKVQIWDTACQERFRPITQTYYRGAMGIIVLYDSSSKESFENVPNWLEQMEIHAPYNANKILICNKPDLESDR